VESAPSRAPVNDLDGPNLDDPVPQGVLEACRFSVEDYLSHSRAILAQAMP